MDVQFVSLISCSRVYRERGIKSCINNRATSSVIALVTPDMLSSISWGTYVFFAAFCLIAFFFTLFVIPETRGKVCNYIFIFLLYLRKKEQREKDFEKIFSVQLANKQRRFGFTESRRHGSHLWRYHSP
jgi:Sugar (and other) transporter